MDDVVKEVGKENVMQIIYNAGNYKTFRLLVNVEKKLFCTPSVIHCTNLILKDFDKKIQLYQERIVSASGTTYIY